MIKRKEVLFFVFLLVVHFIHIIEEFLGGAYFIESFYKSPTNFLIINTILWILPIILLFYVVKKKKIAYYFSIIYSLIMILDGLDHIIRKYNGFYSGFALVILGLFLVYYLLKKLKNMKGGEKMVKQNLGVTDRVLRFVLAFWWLGPWALRFDTGWINWIIIIIGWIALIESFTGWCGLHSLFKINNKKGSIT